MFGKKNGLETPFTPRQKDLIRNTFVHIAAIKEEAAKIFYAKLFVLDPSLKILFKGDMQQQGTKLMVMLAAAVKGLDDLDGLIPVVQDLGRRHVVYGVIDEHYDTVGSALLSTLEAGLGDMWTEEVEEAWTTIYTVLTKMMKEASREAA
ncbi:MAG: hemin receptor [Cyclobacteriaceae bacterium]